MNTNIQTLIEQRPHLKEPLQQYENVRRFSREAVAVLSENGALFSAIESKSYPKASVETIIRQFSAVFGMPEGMLVPLQHAMEAGDIDFTRLPLGEVPAFSLPYNEEELATILFLVSRPYFVKLKSSIPLDQRFWEEGRCPLCSGRPALASITEGPRRLLHCSYCGTAGPYAFIGCPICGEKDAAKLGTLIAEGEEGTRVGTCDECKSYIKIVKADSMEKLSPDVADIVSLPLDMVAQGRGFIRQAPNPIGLRKMVL